MNARKHRKSQQAKEADRLEPKGMQTGSGPLTGPDANTTTAGVQSGPNPSCEHYETRKRCQPRPDPRTRAASPQGGPEGAALG